MPERRARLGGSVPGRTPPRREGVRGGNSSATVDSSVLSSASADNSTVGADDEHRPPLSVGDQPISSSPNATTQPTATGFERATAREPGQSREIRRELRITVSDPYSILCELEHPGTFQIVMLLDREGRTNPYRMRQRLRSGQKALDRALRSLLKARLICRLESESFPFSCTYELSDRGKQLAETMRSWPWILVE